MIPVPAIIDDAGHWRNRSEQMRAFAATEKNVATRQVMIEIADGYEELAQRAERRLGGRKTARGQ